MAIQERLLRLPERERNEERANFTTWQGAKHCAFYKSGLNSEKARMDSPVLLPITVNAADARVPATWLGRRGRNNKRYLADTFKDGSQIMGRKPDKVGYTYSARRVSSRGGAGTWTGF